MNIGLLDVGTGITAAGTSQATAQLLINSLNTLSTVAAGSGVRLNVGQNGSAQFVYNGGANPVSVYPPTGMSINNLPANTAHVLATNTGCQYWVASSTQIIGFLSA